MLVEGVARGSVVGLEEEDDGCQSVEVEVYDSEFPTDDKLEVYMTKVLGAFEQYVKMSHHLAYDGLVSAIKLDDADRFGDQLAAHLMVATAEKQALLELLDPDERLQRLHDLLEVEIEKLHIDKRIHVRVKKQMEKAQKEYYLNEKIKAIQQELGRKDDRADEVDELKEQIEKARMPEEAREKAEQELKRLEAMPPVSAEATVSRNYLDWLVSVPWKKKSREIKDLDRAAEDPRRGPLRPGEGQGAHPRVPRGAPAGQADAGLDPLLRRPAGSRQDLAGHARSPGPRAASSSASRWAACATRPRSAAIAAPTSAPSPARSSR